MFKCRFCGQDQIVHFAATDENPRMDYALASGWRCLNCTQEYPEDDYPIDD